MSLNEIGVEPLLVEAAVDLAVAHCPDRADYQRARERCYEIADVEERDRCFERLSHDWFGRLRLGVPILAALHEQPLIKHSVQRVVVTTAGSKNAQGAELYVSDEHAGAAEPRSRQVGLRVMAPTLANGAALLSLLRREFFYIFDMLDPAFCYAPSLPPAPTGPLHDRLLLDRYSVLWATTVDARMVQRGYAAGEVAAQSLRRFREMFPMLADDVEQHFDRFFRRGRPTHEVLVEFATDPRRGTKSDNRPDAGSRCSLCGCPSYCFMDPTALDSATIGEIRRMHPDWVLPEAVCSQCADLYSSRGKAGFLASNMPTPAR